MDDRAERAPLYRGFFVSPNVDQVMSMVHMEPTTIDNCDGMANKSGCYEIVSRKVSKNPQVPTLVVIVFMAGRN
ncbi:hypothetical protein ANCDUO_09253 [Ancylostoma duodenale]|uniref:Uncharacterized protein n=1 Tax=Ancylostoma duodenale TaxID=51022 RepID=A0A0C2CUC7_9BILA|nr:hypothetical protein ANCDUO_09253 [Ancylostoma duodenale]